MPVLLAESWCPFATAAASALKLQCTTAVAVAVAHESTTIPSPLSSSVTAVVSGPLHERLRRRPHPPHLSLSHRRQGPPSPFTALHTSPVYNDLARGRRHNGIPLNQLPGLVSMFGMINTLIFEDRSTI
uniref:Uncharacterized protein n=1 Tax=Oryza punctata TaxID=4537 RepID=A0A0E0KU75_ORYPU